MRRVLGWGVPALALLLLAGLFAGGWYYSDQLLPAPRPERPVLDVEVVASDPEAGTIALATVEGDLATLATLGLHTDDGLLLLDGPPEVDGAATTRGAILLSGTWPAPGATVAPSIDTFAGDPSTTLGLPHEPIAVPSPLGPLPAWRVVPSRMDVGTTWVVLVHGRGAALAETNRSLAVVGELGLPALTVSLRNDPDAPAAPDGYGHYGSLEWEDLQAAVDHLRRTEGAEQIVLVGYSQGASVALSFLRRSPDAELATGAVLVSPLVSLHATLELQAEDRGIPGPIVPSLLWATRIVSSWRAGLDFPQVEHLDRVDELPGQLRVLLTHGDQDATVPIEPTRRLAEALGDRATFVEYAGAGHVREWNTDRDRFEADLRDFLATVATPAPARG